MTLLGVDISKWNGNWEAVKTKAAGGEFAFIKASQATYTDPFFAANWPKAKEAGLLRGAYHYLDYSKGGLEQANYFADLLDPDRGELPPVADFEQRRPSLTAAAACTCLRDFLAQMKARGYKMILYTSPSYWQEFGEKDESWSQYPLWLAHYTAAAGPTTPAPWTRWTFWQFTPKGNGQVYGTESYNLDVNRFDGTLDDLYAFADFKKPASELEQRIAELEQRLALVEQRQGSTPPVQSPPAQLTYAMCTAQALNVRSGPGASYPVIGWLANGQRVKVLERQNGWARLETPSGWSGERYLRFS